MMRAMAPGRAAPKRRTLCARHYHRQRDGPLSIGTNEHRVLSGDMAQRWFHNEASRSPAADFAEYRESGPRRNRLCEVVKKHLSHEVKSEGPTAHLHRVGTVTPTGLSSITEIAPTYIARPISSSTIATR
jgi:hypothetical protein